MKTFWKLVFSTTIIFSQTGIEIARMFDAKKTPRDMSNVSNMILTNSKGKSRVNKMVSRSLDGNKKQIIWFLEPKDDKGVAFLKIEHENKDDEMRMWLPAFNKVRRISSKKKGVDLNKILPEKNEMQNPIIISSYKVIEITFSEVMEEEPLP